VIFIIGSFALFRAAFKNVKELLDEIQKAKDKESAGGKTITSGEWQRIIKEGKEAFLSIRAIVLKVMGIDWKKKRKVKDLVDNIK
jgi:hypothetical protein